MLELEEFARAARAEEQDLRPAAGCEWSSPCGLLVLLSIPVALPRWRLDGNPKPKPPSQAQINAAENRVRQQQAALGAQQGRLSAANAQLAALQVQAEVLTQRYDQTLVDEQRAAAAYRVTEARLRYAQQAQDASQRQLAAPGRAGIRVRRRLRPDDLHARQRQRPAGLPERGGTGPGPGPERDRHGGRGPGERRGGRRVPQAGPRPAGRPSRRTCAAANHLKLAVQAAVARQQAFVRRARPSGTRWPSSWPAPRRTWPR